MKLGRAKNFPGRALPVLAPTWLQAWETTISIEVCGSVNFLIVTLSSTRFIKLLFQTPKLKNEKVHNRYAMSWEFKQGNGIKATAEKVSVYTAED